MGEINRRLLEQLQQLPPARLTEVETFVEFLTSKERGRQAYEELLQIAPAIEAAGLTPLTEDEILAEVAASRASRRARAAQERTD